MLFLLNERGLDMPRPVKWRQIDFMPEIKHFIPADKISGIKCNVLKLEELEAIRLKDLEGLEQDDCAQNMQVSRPTFRRILISAREKIADSLINGKAISIEGGNYTRNICSIHCNSCGNNWDIGYELLDEKGTPPPCPKCGSTKTGCVGNPQNGFCRNGCRRRNRGGTNHI